MKDDYVYPRPDVGAPGMELRDYFAAHALSGLMAKYGIDGGSAFELASGAYATADSMMTIREMSHEDISEALKASLFDYDEEGEDTND